MLKNNLFTSSYFVSLGTAPPLIFGLTELSILKRRSLKFIVKTALCVLILLDLASLSNSSLRTHQFLASTCLGTCNAGKCVNGVCVCPPGFTGSQCEACFGRIMLQDQKGTITDGFNNYYSLSKCIWVIEGNNTNGPLLLKLTEFFTECCWDHVYVYDGDNVYDTLIAAFSGRLSNVEIVAKSGKAIIYFTSDLAFNLPGFSIDYEYDKCPYNCNNHGKCNSLGNCDCDRSYVGDYCENQICLPGMNGLSGPCIRSMCTNGKCNCNVHTHGDNCQASILSSVWDKVGTAMKNTFVSRASHKAVLVGDKIWIFGGQQFGKDNIRFVVYFDIKTSDFVEIKNSDKVDIPRDHSMVHYNGMLYVFGGIYSSYISKSLMSFDLVKHKWKMITQPNNDDLNLPLAVAGHTAHIIKNEMYVFFGYNPYVGYVYRLQIFSFETNKWRVDDAESLIVGKFGHSSVLYGENSKNPMVLVYGGYNALNSYSYTLSDELLLYDVTANKWANLGKTGVPLFRHSAAILDGIMLIIGGNSHNESSKTKLSDCYSNQVLAYNIECHGWLNIKTVNSSLVNRYGHVAVANDNNMFIIGGFNGMMLNDVIKYTPAKCNSQAKTSDECQRTAMANGIRCIFYNKRCRKIDLSVSYAQPFVSFIKGESYFQSLCTSSRENAIFCMNIKECFTCIDKGCGWCESTQTCLGPKATCEDNPLMTKKKCAYLYNKSQNNTIFQRPCKLEANCFACGQLKHCAWFTKNKANTNHVCVSLSDEAILVQNYDKLQEEAILSRTHLLSEQRFSFPQSSSTTALSSPLINSNFDTSRNLIQDENIVISTGNYSAQTCPPPCIFHSSCDNCIQAQCMWCPNQKMCVPMDTYMIYFPYGLCQSWITAASSNNACQLDLYDCTSQKTCAECQSAEPRCGWCDDNSGTGIGYCTQGKNSGPLNGSCPRRSWYFTGEPVCQCNGHSVCFVNSTKLSVHKRCVNCEEKTRGDHCELCEAGYYGDSRNGGVCKPCQCNEQATLCNRETGDCHCFTKGVTGTHCDKCDTKYEGDPANGKSCVYQLLIDYIFTFKLDGDDVKDKFVNQINFYSIPTKRDTDVQFSITCEGESGAKVSINLSTVVLEGHSPHSKQLMAGQICTAAGIKRTYSSTDPGFAFGTSANTTFYIHVSDFITSLKIVISFAQSPPINWVLFFVIFAACFIVLLVVAGLLWMIKLRIEWYRNIRRRHEEIEEMASRPFASVQLHLNTVNDAIANNSCVAPDMMNLVPTPVAIEPCGNYQAGVYTIVIRLPTGGRLYTPCGTSGLAVGSSLCYLTHAQLALLQPPDSSAEQSRQSGHKSAFRRFIPFMRSSAS